MMFKIKPFLNLSKQILPYVEQNVSKQSIVLRLTELVTIYQPPITGRLGAPKRYCTPISTISSRHILIEAKTTTLRDRRDNIYQRPTLSKLYWNVAVIPVFRLTTHYNATNTLSLVSSSSTCSNVTDYSSVDFSSTTQLPNYIVIAYKRAHTHLVVDKIVHGYFRQRFTFLKFFLCLSYFFVRN